MSTSFGLWLVEKLQNLITDPEFRASAKGSISYYGAGIRPVKKSKKKLITSMIGWKPIKFSKIPKNLKFSKLPLSRYREMGILDPIGHFI